MQNFNYHSHTKRCEHAIGEDEESSMEDLSANMAASVKILSSGIVALP